MKSSPVEKHFDKIAEDYDYYKRKSEFYYNNLKSLLQDLIPPNKKVFEFGCGTGDLLREVRPKKGYGMDISGEMMRIAKVKNKSVKNLSFSTQFPKEKFDYIFMSDVIEHLEDVEDTFTKLSGLLNPKGVLISTMMNPIWEPIERIYTWLGLKMPEGPHKRIRYEEIKLIVDKAGMKIIKHDYRLLMPVKIPLVTDFLNKYLEKYLKPLAFIEYFVAVKRSRKNNRQV